MPESDGFSVYIYTNDHQPAHVHVFKPRYGAGKPSLKIELGDADTPPKIVEPVDSRITKTEAKAAWRLVARNQETLLKEWHRIHGIP